MKDGTRQFSHYVSVPADKGVKIQHSVTIHRPVADLYAFWRHLENLPRFIRHLQSVRLRDDLHSHWVLQPVTGKALEWDAEIIEDRQNEMISWRSTPGADLRNAGSVWFAPLPGGASTRVKLELKYALPEEKAGAPASVLFSRDAEAEMHEDLQRLKALLETEPLAHERVRTMANKAGAVARRAARIPVKYIQQKPWPALASIAVVGLAMGLLLGWALRPKRTCEC